MPHIPPRTTTDAPDPLREPPAREKARNAAVLAAMAVATLGGGLTLYAASMQAVAALAPHVGVPAAVAAVVGAISTGALGLARVAFHLLHGR